MIHRMLAWLAAGAVAGPTSGLAQVMLVPTSTTPAAWERFSLRVANANDTAVVAVMLRLPDGVRMLGVDAPPGWAARYTAATDSTSQRVEWTAGLLERGAFREFPFLVRVAPDLKRGDLTFPVRITRANGSSVEWAAGGAGAAPTVRVRPVTAVTPAAGFALAAFSLGVSVVALALVFSRRGRP